MKIVKRSSDLSIEKISNGFILTLSGRDDHGNYLTDKFFVDEMTELHVLVSDYFELPEDN